MSFPLASFNRTDVARFLQKFQSALEVSIPPDVLEAWQHYAELVATWDAKHDLTAARSTEQLCEILFVDAMVLVDPQFVPNAVRMVDVGAGSGAPSIPLALAREDLRLTLVEPRRKRVAFMNWAIGNLALQHRLSVFEQRVDPKQPTCPGTPFDLALSRATFAPEVWLPISAQLARETLLLSTDTPSALGSWKIQHQRNYSKTVNSSMRVALRLRKCS